jgi:TAG lipase/steryl ester hydrolase/phospholipase A2/LPA acyltransferase
MQLVAYVSLLWLVLVGLVLPNVFIPLVLTGVVDSSVPSVTLLTAWTTLVLALAGSIVILTLIRLRRRVTAVLGGALVLSGLIYFFVSSTLLTADSVYSLRSLQLRVGDTVLILTSIIVWRLACATLNPGVHMLHYMTTAVMLSSLSCRLLDVVERARPLQLLLGPALADPSSEWHLYARASYWSVETTWWFFGLTFDRLRVALSVMNIGIVAFRYALSDRTHHVPSSPLRMALLGRGVLTSLVELIPVGPIIAVRTVTRLVFGRAVLDSVHVYGVLGLCFRPHRFLTSVRLRAASERARDYDEWLGAHERLDAFEGRKAWRTELSPHFDHALVARALETLARVRAEATARGSPHALAELVMSLVNRRFANLNEPHNFQFVGVGTKVQIEALLDGVAGAIEAVVATEWADPEWDAPRKRAFVAAARHAHGCTALCLSGGGAIAMYHMGVVRELLRAGLLPAVISGTSGGAIVAGLLACRTDDELPDFLTEDISTRDGFLWFDDNWTMLLRFAEQGVVVSKENFLQALYPICGDLTFEEAFARTGRLVNLSTSTTSLGATLLLNHIVTPHVLVRSAVQASCALPGVMRPGTLLAKARDGAIVPFESAGLLFRDGSFQSDIPMRELSVQFHATQFIVSQVNGHIAPFLYDPVKPCSGAVRLQRYIVADVRARLDKYAQASYLPTELSNLVAQEYRGKPHDVTIFPRLRLSDLSWRILRHPSEAAMRDFIERGAKMTWPHIRRIAYQTQVERALQQAALALGVDTPRLSWHGPQDDARPAACVPPPARTSAGLRAAAGRAAPSGGALLLPQMGWWPAAPLTSAFGVRASGRVAAASAAAYDDAAPRKLRAGGAPSPPPPPRARGAGAADGGGRGATAARAPSPVASRRRQARRSTAAAASPAARMRAD